MDYRFRTYRAQMGWGGGGWITPAIKFLLIANTLVFLLQTLFQLFHAPSNIWFTQWFGLVPRAVTHGLRIWQPFTYLFLHGGLLHLLLNMLVLWMFGTDVERAWGRKRFFAYYFLTGVGAGVANILVKTLMDATGTGLQASAVVTIGASGAIYGVLTAAAVLFPDRQVWLFPLPVTLPMRAYVFIMGLIAFFGTLGASGDNISHVTHLSGMIIGYLYLRRGSLFFRVRNRYHDWKQKRLRRKFAVYMRKQQGGPPSRPDQWVH